MIYIQELMLRLFYVILLCAIMFCVVFCFKEYALILWVSPLLYKQELQDIGFIFSSPFELCTAYNIICITSAIFLTAPVLMLQTFLFISPGLTFNESLEIKKNFFFFFIVFIFINFLAINFIIPNFWLDIEYYNMEMLFFSYLNIEYEPNIKQYIGFLCSTCFFINLFLIVLSICLCLLHKKSLIEYKRLLFLIIKTAALFSLILFFFYTSAYQGFIISLSAFAIWASAALVLYFKLIFDHKKRTCYFKQQHELFKRTIQTHPWHASPKKY